MNAKAGRKNNLSNYGAGILAAGKALGRRISKAICNERATQPAAKRTSQSCSSYFFALPKAWNWPRAILLACALAGCCRARADGQGFVHPGLLQTREELEFMREKVLAKEEPWKTAWDRLCAQSTSSLDFQPKAIAHIVRGPYGSPSVGDRDLRASADAAYSQALQWFVTRDPAHARKAAQIIDAWSGTLWDFKDNDAKLLAGWTGHTFCNAAEILRHTQAGWDERGQAQFRRMLLTVYYPLVQDFFPEANGNWDAAMMDTMLCMGVYCDDRAMFQRAADHFLRGPGNGGIARYIYPSGQCQESTRDQGHTQLGLGELAQACQIAWNQGVDLYGAADHRLALGLEYTARYLLGESVPSIGAISTQGRGKFSDIYEGAWQHYHFDCGLEMPWVARAVEKVRSNHPWSVLTMSRGPSKHLNKTVAAPMASHLAETAGALDEATAVAPTNAANVAPGQSIQAALDAAADGTWVVLAKGAHRLEAPLRLRSGVTLAGHGRETIIFLNPPSTGERPSAVIVNASNNVYDMALRDLVVDATPAVSTNSDRGAGTLRRDPNASRRQRSAGSSPNRAGIVLAAASEGQMRSLRLEHVTVRDFGLDGVEISGAAGVDIIACDFSGNGGSVPPGRGLEHNLVLDHVEAADVRESRLDDAMFGSGLRVHSCLRIIVVNNELARNARDGLEVTDSRGVGARGNLAEANDRDGIFFGLEAVDCEYVDATGNVSRNNGRAGVHVEQAIKCTVRDNTLSENGTKEQIEIIDSSHVSP
jgi:hypothetical protein